MMASKTRSERQWAALAPPLSPWLLDAVSSMGFTKTTPVQQAAIPMFMGNKDVVVEAVTGSGKTLAYLIPVVERLLRLDAPIKKKHVGAIIISPTRELATQIFDVLTSLLRFHAPSAAAIASQDEVDAGAMADLERPPTLPLPPDAPRIKCQLLLGGSLTPTQDLSRFMKTSPNVLIGTPGRLLELLSSPHVHCPQSSFDALVLDEADRLLDLGFKDDLQSILSRLPKQRRTGLFSASVSEALDQLIRVGLRNPVRIAVKVKARPTTANAINDDSGILEDKRTPASLQMSYLILPPSQRLPAIGQLLSLIQPKPQKTILYLATCYAVDYFQHVLPAILPKQIVVPLHGKQPDSVRRKNFLRFVHSSTPSILLTTDVAARGLDIPAVDLVLQLDPPSDPKTFIHRCGRAGRAGRKGLAITFLSPGREEDYIDFLRVRQTPVTPLSSPALSISQSDATTATKCIRVLVQTDRALYDRAQRGFVSWVRAYSKHTASSIFRVGELDWEDLGQAWGLLRLPAMPELKSFQGDRRLGLSIDFDDLAYKDKVRERQRLEDVTKIKEGSTETGAGKDRNKPPHRGASAWSLKKDIKAGKDERRQRKLKKREHERLALLTEEEKKKEASLRDMIQQVRGKVNASDVFEGFSD